VGDCPGTEGIKVGLKILVTGLPIGENCDP